MTQGRRNEKLTHYPDRGGTSVPVHSAMFCPKIPFSATDNFSFKQMGSYAGVASFEPLWPGKKEP
jgi:hypothetical protein